MLSKSNRHRTGGRRKSVGRALRMGTVAMGLLVLTSGPALAHSQTVRPPGQDGPVVQGPISKAWAQAHCNAQAPYVTGEASDGVVVFSPQQALPCPAVANPGGQIHPDAGT